MSLKENIVDREVARVYERRSWILNSISKDATNGQGGFVNGHFPLLLLFGS